MEENRITASKSGWKKLHYQFSREELQSLLHNYNQDAGTILPPRPKNVSIWDETLRDGEQTPGVSLTIEEKEKIAMKLDSIGTAKIAAGFPAVSENECNIVKRLNKLGLSKTTILGIARPKESDIDACLKADLQEIVLFMPISHLMMKILRETPETEIEKMTRAFEYAKKHGLRYNWVSEDGSRAEPTHLLNTFQTAIDNHAECVILGDTVGILQPETTGYLFEKFKSELKWGPKNKTYDSQDRYTNLGIHCHNDLGQATANTVAAVLHGATFPQVCVNGYGERSGNAAFEEVVVNLELLGIHTGIQIDHIMELSKLVENTFLFPLNAHKAIVGLNSFSHESGLHINAIISHPISYEPYNPALVGQQRRFYLGKFSGSSAIVDALEKKLKLANIILSPEIIQKILKDVKATHENASKIEIQELYMQIKTLIQRVQSGITDKQFFEIVRKDAGDLISDELIDTKESKMK